MKHYGLEIPEGSDITNITAPNGATFPSTPNIGELFHKTGTTPGFYEYDGTAWILITPTAGASDALLFAVALS